MDNPALTVIERMLEAPTEDWVSASIIRMNDRLTVFTGSVKNPNLPDEPDFVGGVDLFDLYETLGPGLFDFLLAKLLEFETGGA